MRSQFWFIFLLNYFDVLNKMTVKCNSFKTWNLEVEEKLLQDFIFLTDFLSMEERFYLWSNLDVVTQNLNMEDKMTENYKTSQMNTFSMIRNIENFNKETCVLNDSTIINTHIIELFNEFNIPQGLHDLMSCLGIHVF